MNKNTLAANFGKIPHFSGYSRLLAFCKQALYFLAIIACVLLQEKQAFASELVSDEMKKIILTKHTIF